VRFSDVAAWVMLPYFLLPIVFLSLAVDLLVSDHLTEEELLEIVAKPHQETPVDDALKIFPNPGKYEFSGKVSFPEGTPGELRGEVFLRRVERKFLVQRSNPPGLI